LILLKEAIVLRSALFPLQRLCSGFRIFLSCLVTADRENCYDICYGSRTR